MSISYEEHLVILMRFDEVTQVKKYSFLAAWGTHYFIFDLDGGGWLNGKESVRTVVAGSMRAA